METPTKKKQMFFRGVEKVKYYSFINPLRALVYLAEIDRYADFAPKKGVYKTNEARIKIFTRLGLKKRAIQCAQILSAEENNFPAHQLLIKTLIHFHCFKEACLQARMFSERHIGKKYRNLLALTLHMDFEQQKNIKVSKKNTPIESVKNTLKTVYYWTMTSPSVIQTRMWLDLRSKELRKKGNQWRYHRFTKTIFFWLYPKRKEHSVEHSSTQQD